jgi:hypothetical protein
VRHAGHDASEPLPAGLLRNGRTFWGGQAPRSGCPPIDSLAASRGTLSSPWGSGVSRLKRNDPAPLTRRRASLGRGYCAVYKGK